MSEPVPAAPEELLSYAEVEKILVEDPRIFHGIDFHGPDPDGRLANGHGMKDIRGPEVGRSYAEEGIWYRFMKAKNVMNVSTQGVPAMDHKGRGVVISVVLPPERGDFTAFALHYQKERSSRPDVIDLTFVPNEPEFDPLVATLRQNARFLLDACPVVHDRVDFKHMPVETVDLVSEQAIELSLDSDPLPETLLRGEE